MHTYVIIDDEPLARDGIRAKLEALSHLLTCIGEADNGMQAKALIETVDPEIIITDMNMPIVDGIGLLSYLSENYPNKPIIVISGYKDFEYARHAIDAKAINYLLKPFGKEELQAACMRAVQVLEAHTSIQQELLTQEEEKEYARYEYDIQMLKNLILGYKTDNAVITSQKLNMINQYHNLVLITLCSSQDLEDNSLPDYLKANGFGDLALYLPHLNLKYMGFLILFLPQDSRVTMKSLCFQVTNSLFDYFEGLGAYCLFGVSGIHSDLMQLNTAFNETVAALNLRRLDTQEYTHFYCAGLEQAGSSVSILWDREREFWFRFESGMSELVDELATEFFQQCAKQSSTLSDLKYFCYQLTSKADTIIEEYYYPFKKGQSLSSKNVWTNLFLLEDIKNYYSRMFTNLSAELKGHNDYAIDDTVEKIKIYIRKNYRNDISLDFLSDLFYLNQTYCSHLFREKTGVKLIDYLNQVRIEKSKELLRDPNKKMYAIAKSVGYDNVKYYFRVFKKLVGMTPSEYRLKGCP